MFYVSASKLNQFFMCPAAYDFERHWEVKEDYLHPSLRDGLTAHAMLSGQAPPKVNARSLEFYQRLMGLFLGAGYKPFKYFDQTYVEQRQVLQVPGAKGTRLVRVVDALAYNSAGELVVIDWKTATWQWGKVGDFVPKAMSFQAAAYLLPPDEKIHFDWPTQIDFLVAPEKGGSTIHSYHRNPDDETNLLNAIKMVKSTKVYPKYRGGHCKGCSWQEMCYGTQGYEIKYQRKERKHGEVKSRGSRKSERTVSSIRDGEKDILKEQD